MVNREIDSYVGCRDGIKYVVEKVPFKIVDGIATSDDSRGDISFVGTFCARDSGRKESGLEELVFITDSGARQTVNPSEEYTILRIREHADLQKAIAAVAQRPPDDWGRIIDIVKNGGFLGDPLLQRVAPLRAFRSAVRIFDETRDNIVVFEKMGSLA